MALHRPDSPCPVRRRGVLRPWSSGWPHWCNDFRGSCLGKCGYIVDTAADGVTGLHLATVGTFDAIVLDVALPGLDGLELSRHLREVARKTTPVLMLTARDALSDKLAGFESGADDYLVKPFALAELDARLRALVKRSYGRTGERELRVLDLCLNLDTMEVKRGRTPIAVKRIGLRILELLMRESHRVVRRQELESLICRVDRACRDRSVPACRPGQGARCSPGDIRFLVDRGERLCRLCRARKHHRQRGPAHVVGKNRRENPQLWRHRHRYWPGHPEG